MLCKIFNFKVWALFSVIWAGAMAYWCYQGWPRLPLDVSSIDPETLKILQAAKWQHLQSHILAAVVPPLVMLAVGWLVCRVVSKKN